MKAKLVRFLPLLFLALPVLFLSVDWYQNVRPDTITFTFKNMTGLSVLSLEHYRIALLYLFCILIQFFSVTSTQFLYAIISEIVLLFLLFIFPTTMYPIKYVGLHFVSAFYIGFYLASIFIICSLVLNVIYDTRVKRSRVSCSQE